MIDEKAKDIVARALYEAMEGPVNNQDFARQQRQWESAQALAVVAIEALQSAKPKEAEGLKLGSRLTVEGVEAVVVPAKHTAEMALAGEAAIEEVMDYTRDTNSTYLVETPMEWAGAAYAAMLSAAGDANG